MLGKTGLSLATSPYPFGYELSRFFLFQFSTINFFFSLIPQPRAILLRLGSPPLCENKPQFLYVNGP